MANPSPLSTASRADIRQSGLATYEPAEPTASAPVQVHNDDGRRETALDQSENRTVCVGVIDHLLFSRDCLVRAFAAENPDLTVVPFDTVANAVDAANAHLDIILCYCHDKGTTGLSTRRQIGALRQAYPNIPIVVLSDAQTALQPKTIRDALNNGAHGFIPTATTGVPAALAAIRFVRDGGIFAPLNLLLGGRPEQKVASREQSPTKRLTPRQTAVLALLRQGKANKIIAYELGMTESTVKVHIRNILRKMGATNRTQAVYNFERLGNLPCGDAVGE